MKMKYLYLFILPVTLLIAAPAFSAEVIQGKCIVYDTENKTITLEEYDLNITKEHPHGLPTGKEVIVDVSGSKIGIKPEPGDTLRIAYKTNSETKKAIKVMNVTKQDLRKK